MLARGQAIPENTAAVLRSLLLHLLPKVLLSRLTGLLASMPLPGPARAPFYRWFARRYGASLTEPAQPLRSYRSLQAFFQRALVEGARPVAHSPVVWPCDGRIVTSGPIRNGRIEQVKGQDYALADLLADAELARALDGGTQATVYLAPGDYHRVHAPFAGRVDGVAAIPGTLFPVNPPAVRSIRDLFARNSRHVFRCSLEDGRPAAVIMVGAFNVGGTSVTALPQTKIDCGQELGRFGFGSTAIVVLPKGGPGFAALASQTRVRMGEAAQLMQ
jgi:phosphatidylserine decarboxylase